MWIPQVEKEKRMYRKQLAVFFTSVALLVAVSAPALAQVTLNVSTVTVNSCTVFHLYVEGVGFTPGDTGHVDYVITLTPASGPQQIVSGSVPVVAPVNGGFSNGPQPASMISVGPFAGTFTLGGTATPFDDTHPASGQPRNLIFQDVNGNPISSISCPGPSCTGRTTNTSNFNGTSIQQSNIIWFNANFTASGVPSSGATVFFQNSTIEFTANGVSYNAPVPNSVITFSPSVSCASVSFDTTNHQWIVTVPVSGSDEIFLSGLSFPVPSGGLPGGIKNVTWSGTFSSSTSGISDQWKWGAAIYTSFGADYNSLGVKPTHQNACNLNNGDHAGTPENFKSNVVGGATGGGGSNWTGSWSGTQSVKPSCS
jgi:hypothetical protein